MSQKLPYNDFKLIDFSIQEELNTGNYMKNIEDHMKLFNNHDANYGPLPFDDQNGPASLTQERRFLS